MSDWLATVLFFASFALLAFYNSLRNRAEIHKQCEAVKAGAAHWDSDDEGRPVFKWKEPHAKTETD